MQDPLLSRLAERLVAAPHLLVVTGAGISLASGIPTFRGTDSGAIWARETTEIGTAGYLAHDPVGWWTWVLQLRDVVLEARPNAAHRSLALLERWHRATHDDGSYLLITQNIDLLHEKAGSERLVKVHGTADRLRCSRSGCAHGAPTGSLPASDFDLAPLRRDPRPEHLPRCPECGAVVRGHVLLFDEYYDEHVDYEFERVHQALGTMNAVLFVGTSFSVGLTDLVLRAASARRTPTFSIDPGDHRPPPGSALTALRGKAEELLPRLCDHLGIASAPRMSRPRPGRAGEETAPARDPSASQDSPESRGG